MNKHGSLNRAYRIIWSYAKQCLVVVSEIAKSNGKPSGERSLSPFTLAETRHPFYSTDPPPLRGFKPEHSRYPISLMGRLSLITAAVNVGLPTGAHAFGDCSSGPYVGGYTGCYNRSETIQSLTNTGSDILVDGTIAAYGGGVSIISGAGQGLSNDVDINTLTNAGTILGPSKGVINSGLIGTIDNTNTIGSSFLGILNNANATIGTLINRGTISGGSSAIRNAGTISALTNSAGTIKGISNYTTGSSIIATISQLTNNAVISGNNFGILNSGGSGSLNQMVIGTLTNSGLISGINGIVNYETIGTLNNSGSISGNDVGIYNSGTIGTLSNSSGGIISGSAGVFNYSGTSLGTVSQSGTIGTLINSGSIIGGYAGVYNVVGTIGTLSNSGSIFAGNGVDNSQSGTIGTLSNSGTISGGSYGVNNESGTIDTLSNSGTISGTDAGVYNTYYVTTSFMPIGRGTIGTLINSGTISGRFGVSNESGIIGTLSNSRTISGNTGVSNHFGTIGTLSNTGTITGIAVDVSNIYGTLGVLNNLQGAANNNALTYSGTLANSYNIIIDGASHYGELSAQTVTGTMAFGIDTTDSTSIVAGTFANVLEGFTGTINNGTLVGSGFDVTNLSGTVGALNYSLVETDSTLGDWSLVISSAHTSAYGTSIAGSISISTLTNTGSTLTGTIAGVYNQGTIGSLLNPTGQTISGSEIGVFNSLGTIGTLSNSGTISGGSYGVINDSGTIGTLSNSGTMSGGRYAGVLNYLGTIDTLNNSGTINSGGIYYGVYNSFGTIGTLGNSGIISGEQYGIINASGTIGTLSNTGTITGGTVDILNNYLVGSIPSTLGVLNNLQGVNGTTSNPLTYAGALAANYNIIIDGSTHYGELSATTVTIGTVVSTISGNMAFGIDTTDSTSIVAGTFANVLEGFMGTISNGTLVGSGFDVTHVIGTVGTLSYSLVADTLHSGDWNLVLKTLAYGTSIGSGTSISSLTNSGTLSGTIAGVYNQGTIGSLLNPTGQTISGGHTGIDNAGSIGTLSNSGRIYGAWEGISAEGSIGTLSNTGIISSAGVAIYEFSGQSIAAIVNGTLGTLSGYIGILNNGNIASVTNSGLITSGGTAAIYNDLGTIGLLTNSGTIAGTGFNAILNNLRTSNGTTTSQGAIGVISNTGVIAGNIYSPGSNLSITGGEGTIVGTLLGGSINAGSNTLTFSTGNQLVSDVIGTVAGVSVNSGSGTVTFGGNNTYTANTTISSGTLQVGTGSTVGSLGIGTIVDNGVLAFDRSDNMTIANTISGSGSLNQLGTGTAILTGSSTYTGATTISSGTLQIGNGNASGNLGSGSIFDGGVLAFNRSDSVTIGNLISGSGSLNQIGGGTLILTQNNAYTGATSISSGTLSLNGSGSIASSSGVSVAETATFDVSNTSLGASIKSLAGAGSVITGTISSLGLTITNASGDAFSGTISGDGGLTLSGGTQTLSGINTYTGGTQLNGGTLAINTVNSLGAGTIGFDGGTLLTNVGMSIASDLFIGANNGTIDNSGYYDVFSGTVSGSGRLNFMGVGTTLFTGTNNSSGGTGVEDGQTLEVSSSSSLGSGTIYMANGSALSLLTGGDYSNSVQLSGDPTFTVAPSQTVTWTEVISDGGSPGELVKDGTGTLVLDAANTYTGPTQVDQGNLVIGDSAHPTAQITSPTTVNNGGTLSGYGSVLGNVTVASGGTVAPGSTGQVGTLNVVGTYTQNAGSYLDINVTPASASKVNVTGNAVLNGGTVNATAIAGTSNLQSKYTILYASNGVTGRFSSLIFSPSVLNPILTYDANDAYLSFQANLAGVATNQNQYAVGTGIDYASTQSNSAAGQSLLNTLTSMTNAQAQAAMTALSGEGISAQQSTNFEATELAVDSARRQGTYWLMNECQTGASSKKNNALPANALPMTCSSNDNRQFRGWVAGVGGSNSMSGSSTVGSSSVSSQTGGGMAGFDYEVSPNLLVGMMAGATSSSYNVSNLSSSGSIASGQFGLYSVAKWQRLYLNTVFDYGYFSNASTRYVSGIGATSKETSSNNSNAFTGRAEVGYRVEHPVVNMMPFIAMQATSLQMGTYSESNTNGLGLTVQAKNVMSEPGSLGVQLDKAYDLDQEWSLYPLLRMAWVHEFQTTRTLTASLQSLPTGGWTVSGASAAANAANIGISLQAMNKDGFAFFASGNVVASPTTESYMGQVGFKLLW